MRVGAADYVRNDQSLPCASKPFRCSSRSVPRATVRAGHRAYAVSHPSEGCEANAARMSWNLIWRVLPVLLLMRLVQGRLAGGSIKRWRQPFALVARDLLFLLGCCAVPGYGFCLSKRATRHGSACGVERAFFWIVEEWSVLAGTAVGVLLSAALGSQALWLLPRKQQSSVVQQAYASLASYSICCSLYRSSPAVVQSSPRHGRAMDPPKLE
jgi:hypothetical protein